MKKILVLFFLLFSFLSFAQKAPINVSVKNTSYTVPTGKWARVIVCLEGTSTFSINSVVALKSNELKVLSTSANQVYGSGTVQAMMYNNITSNDQKRIVTAVYNLPSGSVIAGAGAWLATVELYER